MLNALFVCSRTIVYTSVQYNRYNWIVRRIECAFDLELRCSTKYKCYQIKMHNGCGL